MTDRIIGALLISILTVLLEDIISKVKDEKKGVQRENTNTSDFKSYPASRDLGTFVYC